MSIRIGFENFRGRNFSTVLIGSYLMQREDHLHPPLRPGAPDRCAVCGSCLNCLRIAVRTGSLWVCAPCSRRAARQAG